MDKTNVSELGEFGLIDHLTAEGVIVQPTTIKGIGDDAAVIDSGAYYTLISTDMLIEDIHFDLSYTPLKHLGYKAVVVNLSDIYAMNGIPKQITVSIAISNRFSVEALEELYKGIHLACRIYNVDLVGGDTTSSLKGLVISVTAIGVVEKERIVYRSGAKPGDLLCVTGHLGGAYLGLQILEREKQVYLEHPDVQPELDKHEYVVGRMLKPEARKDAIAYFEQKDVIPTSMIDISDGLSSEIMHICKQSGVGVVVEEAKVPIEMEAQQLAIELKLHPITCAMHGGEDYELLFTIDEDDLEVIKYMPDIYIVGEVRPAETGIKLLTTGGNIHDVTAQGWNHFKP